jgi:hypothetical protein
MVTAPVARKSEGTEAQLDNESAIDRPAQRELNSRPGDRDRTRGGFRETVRAEFLDRRTLLLIVESSEGPEAARGRAIDQV